jgi:hypothetical protein
LGVQSCAEAGLVLEKKEVEWRRTLERREEKRQKAQLLRAVAESSKSAAGAENGGVSTSAAASTAAVPARAPAKPAVAAAAGDGNAGSVSDDEVIEVGEASLDDVLKVRMLLKGNGRVWSRF